jgi:hypothetical protein
VLRTLFLGAVGVLLDVVGRVALHGDSDSARGSGWWVRTESEGRGSSRCDFGGDRTQASDSAPRHVRTDSRGSGCTRLQAKGDVAHQGDTDPDCLGPVAPAGPGPVTFVLSRCLLEVTGPWGALGPVVVC